MYKLMTAAVAATLMGGAAWAAPVTFNDLTVGTALSTFDFGGGLTGTASADGASANSPDVPVVFATEASNTADPDLQSPFTLAGSPGTSRSFGNAIIAQENPGNNGVFDPDDDGNGGTVEFKFDNLISLGQIFLLDAKLGASVTLFLGNDVVSQLLTTVSADTGNNPNNNLYTFLDFNDVSGDRFVVDFNGKSGAIGEFHAEVAPIPVPASLPLLLAGFGALGYVARRKKAS